MKRTVVVLATVLAIGWIAPRAAQAIPAFATQTGIACQGCHTAFPTLNATGRMFKKNGYSMSGTAARSSTLPISARLLGRVLDNRENGDPTRIDSLHEVELFVAGPVADDVSIFAEVEGEDEDGFAMAVSAAVVNFRHSDALNVQVGRAPVFFADPYDTLADGGRRMTAEHKGVLDIKTRVSTGGAENAHRLRDAVQQANVNGQVGPVWYMAGVSGGGKTADVDKVGADPKDFQGRLALDLPDGNTMVGGFYYGGEDTLPGAGTDDFSVYGFDARHDNPALGLTVLVAGVWLTDDYSDSATDVEVTGGYVEALRPIDVGGRALVPLVRFNWADGDGSASDSSLDHRLQMTTAQLSYYMRDNARVTAEFTNFDHVAADQRIILGFDVAL